MYVSKKSLALIFLITDHQKWSYCITGELIKRRERLLIILWLSNLTYRTTSKCPCWINLY